MAGNNQIIKPSINHEYEEDYEHMRATKQKERLIGDSIGDNKPLSSVN
jgi:hypothetical protein